MKSETDSRFATTATRILVVVTVLLLAVPALGAAAKTAAADRDGDQAPAVEKAKGDGDHERSARHHRHRRVRRYHVSLGWPFYGWGRPYRWGWYPAVYVGVGSGYYGDEIGALDLDIAPEEVQVYLDGTLIGTADDFDGYPEFLWLEEGTYDLVFYHPGYKTIARQYTIRPGVVIGVEDRMQPGEAVPPEDLIAKSTRNRDERLRAERERRAEAERWERERRAEARRERRGAGGEIGRLHVQVRPDDAAVYLDGHFLGTGQELAQLSAGLIVDPGEHLIEAVHPEYEPEKVEIAVRPGERLELEVELQRH